MALGLAPDKMGSQCICFFFFTFIYYDISFCSFFYYCFFIEKISIRIYPTNTVQGGKCQFGTVIGYSLSSVPHDLISSILGSFRNFVGSIILIKAGVT